jgi:Flp pilus assembly protein protease CpaA
MAIGFRELIVLMVLFAVACIVIGGVVWLAVRGSRASSQSGSQRPVADRLAELESLRRAGQISTDEHDKRRAQIISSI